MPRNGSGTYSLPEAAFVPGTVISSTAVNNDFSDIATALTGSLARDGQGGMLDVLSMAPGGFTYSVDPDTGMYRSATNSQAIKCGGSDIVDITTTGVDITGAIKQRGFDLIPVGFGPVPWSGTSAPSGWVLVGRAYSRTTYADLWAFASAEIANGNTFYGPGDGSTTFTVGANMPGRIPACNDSISGSAANVLTSTYYGAATSTIGSPGGSQSHTLTGPELPAVAPTFTGTPATITVSSTVGDVLRNPAGLQVTPGSGVGGGAGTGQPGGYAITSNGGYTPQGTVGNLGAGQAHSIVQPSIITNYIVFAGA